MTAHHAARRLYIDQLRTADALCPATAWGRQHSPGRWRVIPGRDPGVPCTSNRAAWNSPIRYQPSGMPSTVRYTVPGPDARCCCSPVSAAAA